MRVDDGEHVAAIERLAEPGDESGIEAAPIEVIEDTDTVPNEIMEGDEEDGDDEADDATDDESEEGKE
jgi:hypothetical protein